MVGVVGGHGWVWLVWLVDMARCGWWTWLGVVGVVDGHGWVWLVWLVDMAGCGWCDWWT